MVHEERWAAAVSHINAAEELLRGSVPIPSEHVREIRNAIIRLRERLQEAAAPGAQGYLY